MDNNSVINFSNKKQTFFAILLLFAMFGAFFTFSQKFQYVSESKLLVIQKTSNSDPYLASRANEYLSSVLSRVVGSEAFFADVLTTDFSIKKSYFPQNSKDKLKTWRKTVKASPVADSGIIDIKVYHEDRYQAEQIAQAVDYVMQHNHQKYHGLGDEVSIKIIDQPIVSDRPASPNVLLNMLASLILGFFIALIYIYFFPEEKYNIRLWPKRKKKHSLDEQLLEELLKYGEQELKKKNNVVSKDNDDLDYKDIIKKGDIKNVI